MDEAAMDMTAIAAMMIATGDIRQVIFDCELMILGRPFYSSLIFLNIFTRREVFQRRGTHCRSAQHGGKPKINIFFGHPFTYLSTILWAGNFSSSRAHHRGAQHGGKRKINFF
jgi:hypothetical protein